MAIRYYKFFDILQRRGIKKTAKQSGISAPTFAKLSSGANINTEIINRICSTLEVQPGDIMEYVKEE